MKVAAVVPVSASDLAPASHLALAELAGKPLLAHVCDRLACVERLQTLIIVTTADPTDDPIADFCRMRALACFRSGEADELARVLAALKSIEAKAGAVVRAGSPLIDPAIVDHVVNLIEMTDGMVDFIGTDLAQTYPRGMEVEAFTLAALDDADRRCADPEERRSAALYLRRNSRLYRLLGVKAEGELARPDLALDVGGAADLARLEPLLRHFAGRGDAGLGEIIAYLDTLQDAVQAR